MIMVRSWTICSISAADSGTSRIQIDETCRQITGFIDFEGTTITPLWACATRIVPVWLLPQAEDDLDGFTEGSFAKKEHLRSSAFLPKMGRTHDG
jgi:hypothetical protein